jgi:hypothetical protein
MAELLLLLLSGFGVITGVVVVRTGEAARWRRELVAYELRFPRDLEPDAVTAFITGLSGLVASRWSRPFAQRAVMIEVVATSGGISHRLLVPEGLKGTVLGQLRASLPQVAIGEEVVERETTSTLAGELRLSDSGRHLQVDNPQPIAASILASLQPLEHDERLIVQWMISPAGPVSALRSAQANSPRTLALNVTTQVRDGEALRAARVKRAHALFHTTLRLGVVASPERSRQLLRHLTAAFHTANAPGAHLRRRDVPSRWTAYRIAARWLPLFGYATLLNAAELTALLAFPIGSPQLPGLRLGGCRRLMPSADLPSSGKIVARSNFPGVSRALAIEPRDSVRHLHVCGPSGAGKSTLLANLIVQDMAMGFGVVVVDPKGDLVTDVLDRVPEHRRDDVVLFDPTDDERPVGLNILSNAGDDAELVVEQVVAIFHQLYGAQLGPRSRDVLHSTLLTQSREPGMTLCETPLVLTDPAFRRRLTSRLDDPVGLGPFWAAFDALSEGERAQWIGPLMNKLRTLLLRQRIRNVIGQAEPRFSFEDALDKQRIVFVSLRRGLLGDDAAALIGALVIARLWQAVSRRSGQPSASRKPVVAYIDEVQDYLSLPTNVADLLVQARGLGLGLTLSHQHLAQLPPPVRSAILANCGSRVFFQLSATDAQGMAREVAPYLTASDLQQLGPYEVVAQLAVGPRTASPATGVTSPLVPSMGTAELVRGRSRDLYGRDRLEVEAEIRERHQPRPGGGRIGRAS